ncbi:MAG: DUF3738 domain-containing protein [Puia sp.]
MYGKFWQDPKLEIKDSSIFDFDGFFGKNMFCYSLIVPTEKATDEFLGRIMKQDLRNYFGFEVVLKKKKMPYWRVVASNSAKIKMRTKGAAPNIEHNVEHSDTRILIVNQSLNVLIQRIAGLNFYEPPFLDETGINGNIDIQMDGDLENFSVLKKELHKNGIDLKKGEKLMTVMTIKDPS